MQSPLRLSSKRNYSNSAPLPASHASGATEASAPKPATFSLRSMVGSPKDLARWFCKKPKNYLISSAAMSMARRWRDQGRRKKAHEMLAPVYGWFTEGFDTPVLQDAKALLDEVAP